MIYATPEGEFTAIVEGFPTGLSTVGVRIKNADGSSHTPRTTTGVVELEAGSGAYAKDDLIAPDAQGTFVVIWDDGSGSPQFDSEELRVLYTLPAPGAGGDLYTDVADLRGALSHDGASDDQATAASLSDEQLLDAISEAQQEIDAQLGARYSTPFDEVPPLVAQLTRDLAAYGATLTHRRYQPLAEKHPVQLRYDRARELLRALARGEAELPDTDEDSGAQTTETVYNDFDGDLFAASDFGLTIYP